MKRELAFDILENESGELLIAVENRQGDPQTPKIMYDGKDHALFYRKPNQVIVLDYLNKAVREKLYNAKNVKISESNEKELVMVYDVPIKQASILPIPKEEGLMTLEELAESDKSPQELMGLSDQEVKEIQKD